jgi:hypothetical protein
MYVQTGKTFFATLIAVVLALGGLAWLSSDGRKNEPVAMAQTSQSAPAPAAPAGSAYESSSNASSAPAGQTTYEDGYRAGYRDGHQDCGTTQNTSVRRAYYGPRYSTRRARVAGATYYAAPRRGHSTRNMILRIAAPAAIGAGIGAIAKGGKGAGIGALLGGGGGALYHLIRHGRD